METGGGSALETLLCIFWLASTLPIAAGLPIPVAGGGRTVRRLICTVVARGKTYRASPSKVVRLRAAGLLKFTFFLKIN